MQVRQQTGYDARGGLNIDEWLTQLPLVLEAGDQQRLREACELTRVAQSEPAPMPSESERAVDARDWASASDCFVSGLDIALILAELQVDGDCLVAGVLYRAVRERRIAIEAVEQTMGSAVPQLITGVLKMAAIGALPLETDSPVLGQAHAPKDNVRKMLIALVDDVRVALIKLAERTCAIRAVKDDVERRQLIGQEVFDVYAPLAHRLGIGQLKWELEDLSFRYLYPEAYRKIARLLDGKRSERDDFIDRVTRQLSQELSDAQLEFEIAGRAKHIYSIWRKMQAKGIGFSQVYDIRAVRVLVPQVKDCYATLGVIHGLWRNIPNEFDDYIANPKENGYRSLHTAVFGPEGKILEVQIRTPQMHEEAELGVCAHWRYKGSDAEHAMASTYEEKIAWLRQVLDWHEETGDAELSAEQLRFNIAQDRIYTFTPDGDVVNLASGATPLDFAYHVHTEIGHRCRGAKVNGVVVPLTHRLETGDRVEILTSQEAHPRRDWLSSESGYLQTSRARAQVQYWFKNRTREDNIDAGRQLFDKAFRDVTLTSVDYQRIAHKMQYSGVEDMYAAIGSGELSAAVVLESAIGLVEGAPESEWRASGQIDTSDGAPIAVLGTGSLPFKLAQCCKPLPGDDIEGFVTKRRTVSVHRADCKLLQKFQQDDPQRILALRWENEGAEHQEKHYEVELAIEALDRPGLLRDITHLFANARINVLAINTHSNIADNTASMRVRAEMPSAGSLAKLLERIARLNTVISATRVTT